MPEIWGHHNKSKMTFQLSLAAEPATPVTLQKAGGLPFCHWRDKRSPAHSPRTPGKGLEKQVRPQRVPWCCCQPPPPPPAAWSPGAPPRASSRSPTAAGSWMTLFGFLAGGPGPGRSGQTALSLEHPLGFQSWTRPLKPTGASLCLPQTTQLLNHGLSPSLPSAPPSPLMSFWSICYTPSTFPSASASSSSTPKPLRPSLNPVRRPCPPGHPCCSGRLLEEVR